MSSDADPVPACEETITPSNWRWARDFDIDTFEPCSYCFPDAECIADVESPVSELIVTNNGGRTFHRHEETGPVSYKAVNASRTPSDINHQLQDEDFGPEDLGLGSSKGGDA